MAMTLGGFITSVIDTLRAPKEAAFDEAEEDEDVMVPLPKPVEGQDE